MDTNSLVIERYFDAPPTKVWEALTQADKMKKWYFNLSSFKAEVGHEFEFAGQDQGKSFLHLCKVLEVIPNQKLSYSWTYDKYPGYSVLTFELFPENAGTRLILNHSGLESFPSDNPSFARKSFEGGWNHIINISLKEYLETLS